MTKEAIIIQVTAHPNYMMEKSFRLRFPEAYAEIVKTEFPENFTFNQKLYHWLHDDPDLSLGVCPECGKRCGYINFFRGYSKYCCIKCSSNSKDVRDKTARTCTERFGSVSPLANPEIREAGRETMLEKYGVEYAMRSDNIRDRAKHTNMEKYGAEYPSQNKDIREKVKRTNKKRYGVEYPSQSEEVINKWKRANLEKYGVECPMQCQAVREKSRRTCLEKYGCESHNSSPDVKRNKANACLEKYGVENPFQIEFVKEHIRKTNMERYGVENPFASPEIMDKIRKTNIGRYGRPYPNVSRREDELYEYISTVYTGEIVRNDRSVIGLEFDLYLPEIRLAVEFNGDFWHMNPAFYNEDDINPVSGLSAARVWERDSNKRDLAEKNGVSLFVVWEHEWKHDKDKTKENIKDIIYSRIKTLDE